ncbi:MAG: hypothetical protein OEQ18_12200 [Gammaproteobacteria bacterium]|nr:hypothetical protein [Gammaproteobacteria bacterium]
MSEIWPWVTLAGLGAFHGLNPAMGWLFAVALGLHRRSRRVVVMSLLPIALGHAIAIAVVVAVVLTLGIAISQAMVRDISGVVLIGWAVYHMLYGHRQRVRVGMQTGMAGLALWSFLMATAHGAGWMLVPALMPLCLAATSARETTAGSPLLTSLAAIGVHTLAMLAVTGLIAVIVYEWLGLAFLRRGWINLDYLWIVVLLGAGTFLLWFE